MTSPEGKIFTLHPSDFEATALDIFHHQYRHVAIYSDFCNCLKKTPDVVKSIADIPFLPVEFFKSHTVMSSGQQAEIVFESSGTTGSVSSKHPVADVRIYEKSFLKGFEHFYNLPEEYAILALLPSYLERKNSSLVYMVEKLIQLSGRTESGFFLSDFEELFSTLTELKNRKQKTILIGVTFGLLDFAEKFSIDFPDLIVMETGGMKGRREELTREEVHLTLCKTFGVTQIHSEYGMTELLSQAYSKGEGKFLTPPWMKVVVKDLYDPMGVVNANKVGLINIIDLANIYSCAFIATGDLGRLNEDGSFEVLGRMDNAEIRGCNLMVR